jgi:hypothetical protein
MKNETQVYPAPLMDPFYLPVQIKCELPKDPDEYYINVSAHGLLASVGGVWAISMLCKDVDPGDCMTPVWFQCEYGELESIRQLLEETLQHKNFDRDRSCLRILEFRRIQ